MKSSAVAPSTTENRVTVELAKYPYPCRAMLAVCSDLDETPDWAVYWHIMRFLNTTALTPMGAGVGLEVGNSIYFMMPEAQFSYFGTDDAGREMAQALMRSGHIDCLHSYGDYARTRHDAERVLSELVRHRCEMKVWVDHSKAPSNFGPDIMRGSGDVAGSNAYHADLTVAYGVRYVWRGRTTSIAGQNTPITLRSLRKIVDPAHGVGSMRTAVKQLIKVWLGRRSRSRWQMHASNCALRADTLRDGRPIWEFLRSNPHWAGTGAGATAQGIGSVLTQRFLNDLIQLQGVCILYTHLGKVRDPRTPFDERTKAAFRRLTHLSESHVVHVTTTHRFLRYLTVRDAVCFTATRVAGRATIIIQSIDDPVSGPYEPSPDDVIGLTFILDRCDAVEISLMSGQRLGCSVVHNGPRTMASVPWRHLDYPDLN